MKICHKELELDRKLVKLTEEMQKLKKAVDLNIISNISETKRMIKNKKTQRDSLIKQKENLKHNRENQRKVRKRKKAATAAASFNQPATQNENQYLTSRSAGRPKSIDEDILIKTKTDLPLVGSSAESRRRTKVINSC